MPISSYDAAWEVVLPIGFLHYYIPERACIAAEPLGGHLNSVSVVV
jgi:hypothetical protein